MRRAQIRYCNVVVALKNIAVLIMICTISFYFAATYKVARDVEEYKIFWLIMVSLVGVVGICISCIMYVFAHLVETVDRFVRQWEVKTLGKY